MTVIVINNTSRTSSTAYLGKLITCLEKHGITHFVVSTMAQFEATKWVAKAYILSGSATHVPQMSDDQKRLNVAAIRSGRPVLGICFGAQFLAKYFGGEITKMSRFVCDSRVIRPDGFRARFCAQYRVLHLSNTLVCTQTAHLDGESDAIVAFRHKSRPIFATLYHPEYYQHTHGIIMDFVRHIHI